VRCIAVIRFGDGLDSPKRAISGLAGSDSPCIAPNSFGAGIASMVRHIRVIEDRSHLRECGSKAANCAVRFVIVNDLRSEAGDARLKPPCTNPNAHLSLDRESLEGIIFEPLPKQVGVYLKGDAIVSATR
jgi:hypothetical protein